MIDLTGRTAVVTGGANGLGREIVKRFAAAGATTTIADVAEAKGEELAASLAAAAGAVEYFDLDVSDEDGWARLVADHLARHERIDVLVNNAGVMENDELADTDLSVWSRVLAINLTGVFLGMRAVIPAMRERRSGSIINTSSTWGVVGAVGSAAYQASKGGVTVLTKNAAATYAKDGIRVNSVHPGAMRTHITDVSGEEVVAKVAAATPMGRLGEPAEVAGAYVYLASDEASYTTGATLLVDGGYTAV